MKPLITLCAILGNEEATVERFLRSFSSVADVFSLVGARGNAVADKTLSIALRVCHELGKTVFVSEYQNKSGDYAHVDNFSAARQVSWDQGTTSGSEWLMWADCDDTISEESANLIREEASKFEKDVLIVPYEVRGKAQIVHRERLVRNAGFSRWRYPIHEMISFSRDVEYRIVKGSAIVHAPTLEKKVVSDRNQNILLAEADSAGRSFFFLHMEAFEKNDASQAMRWAKTALACTNLEDLERYEILINLAQMDADKDRANLAAAQAFALMPDRREALALLVNFALIDGRNREAEKLCRLMMSIPSPDRAYWTLNNDWYGWKGLSLYAACLRKIGKHDEALALERKRQGVISVVHPTFKRPAKAQAMRELWLSRARNPASVEYIFALSENDETKGMLSGYRNVVAACPGFPSAFYAAADNSTGKVIALATDDVIPPQDWDVEILQRFSDLNKPETLRVSDGCRADGLMTFWYMTRAWYQRWTEDRWNGPAMYMDNDFTARAEKAGVVVEARDLVFQHRHPAFDSSIPWDETYKQQNAPEAYAAGEALFKQRNPEVVS